MRSAYVRISRLLRPRRPLLIPLFAQVFYDPLIAKLIVHGSDRTEALRILRKALAEYQIVGPHTNIEFLKALASHESFIAGDVETGFIGVGTLLLFTSTSFLSNC